MNISTFQSNFDFIKSLYFHEEWKDEDCRDTILRVLEKANEQIEQALGESLHRLHEHKPTVEAVEKVVKKFPSTLSYEDDEERIPLQKVAYYYNESGDETAEPEYVPILAKEGMKHKVGGEDARGGLLLVDPSDFDGWNTLQQFCFLTPTSDDPARLTAVKELRKLGLLQKKDIKEYSLLFTSVFTGKQSVFDYLVP